MKIGIAVMAYRPDLLSQLGVILSAAHKIATQQDEITVWLLGESNYILAEQVEKLDCDKILWAKGRTLAYIQPETILVVLERLYKQSKPDLILFNGDFSGNELAVRLSFRIGGSCITNVQDIAREDDYFVATRGVYSMNLNAKFALKNRPYVLTVAKGVYDVEKTDGSISPFITEINDLIPTEDGLWYCDVEIEAEVASDSIETTSIIVAGGRGVGSKAGMVQLNELAEAIGGKLGATRPAALDGWIGLERMIGASGKITKPDLCIAIGASGAAPFLAGVQNSKILVAVNNNPQASIFKYCDVGIVEDYKAIISELMTLLKTR